MKRIKEEDMEEIRTEADLGLTECGCGYTYFTSECPRCSVSNGEVEDDNDEIVDKFGENIFLPLTGNFSFIDSCGNESKARCEECDIDNCTKSRRYKLRLAYLQYHGVVQ